MGAYITGRRALLSPFSTFLIGSLHLLACSGSETSNTGSGGTSNSAGGAPSNGGSPAQGGQTTQNGGANANGGTNANGGSSNGGANANGGTNANGGSSNGGATANGGSSNGGSSNGGASAGGANTGGKSSSGGSSAGGSANGGKSSAGGSANGGASSGGASSGGAGGASGGGGNTKAKFWIGADVSDQEYQSEATRATLLSIMKMHGFNAVRLRAFVDPKAADGYDKTNGYCDTAHTVAFGKQIKDAGMALMVDFHYSDNWADPGKQCVPVAWQSYTTIAQLATAVHDYTKDAITKLIAGGARPDIVQVGNETTPGMLLHRCDSGGQPTGSNPVTGSTSNWANLGALLKAGVDGVKEVDPTIMTSFHIDRGGDKRTDSAGAAMNLSINWLTNALKYTSVDAFGESCYQRYQGDPNDATWTKAGWTSTLGGIATKFPNVKIFAAEYGPMQREINDVLFAIPNEQGIGTFNWEPTTRGDWNTGGHDLLRWSGGTYAAQPDLALYDAMKTAYASRL